jgi:hypothetical protein
VELEHQGSGQSWSADSATALRYRLTAPGTAPLYGNVR